MAAKIQVIFYSTYGHTWKLAEAIAAGAREVADTEVIVTQVPEILPAEVLEKMGATGAKTGVRPHPGGRPAQPRRRRRHHPGQPDAVRLGHRLDAGVPRLHRRPVDAKGALIGKVGSAFTSTASQHGGQETTLVNLHTFFYHQGMLVTGVPYAAQELLNLTEISGGTPYGATHHRRPPRRTAPRRPTSWPSPKPRASTSPRPPAGSSPARRRSEG